MDKLKIIRIINELLELYYKDKLNSVTVIECIDKVKNNLEDVDDDIIAYEETNLTLNIFKKCPYYNILNEISIFIDKLESLANENITLKKYLILIKAYFEDITPKLFQRIITEVNAHLYLLVKRFYQNNKKNTDLKTNICNLNILLGTDTSESFHYTQEKFCYKDEKMNLRDEISKTNYKTKNNMEKALKKLFVNYYDENLLESFQYYLDDVISEIFIGSLEESLDVKILYYDQLDKIIEKVKKEWEYRKPQNDEYQLKLNLL